MYIYIPVHYEETGLATNQVPTNEMIQHAGQKRNVAKTGGKQP